MLPVASCDQNKTQYKHAFSVLENLFWLVKTYCHNFKLNANLTMKKFDVLCFCLAENFVPLFSLCSIKEVKYHADSTTILWAKKMCMCCTVM